MLQTGREFLNLAAAGVAARTAAAAEIGYTVTGLKISAIASDAFPISDTAAP